MTKPILAIAQDFQTTKDDQENEQYFAVFNLKFEGESELQELRIQTTKNYREMLASNVPIQAADGTATLSAELTWQNALLQSWNAYDTRGFFNPFGQKEKVTFELNTEINGFSYDLTFESKSILDRGFREKLNSLTSGGSPFTLFHRGTSVAGNIMSPFNKIPVPTFQDESTRAANQAEEAPSATGMGLT